MDDEQPPRQSPGSTRRLLNFDEAVGQTINDKRPKFCVHMLWHNMTFLVLVLGILACNPIILGLHFLEKEPKYFKCKDRASGQWNSCTKTEICSTYGADEKGTMYFAVRDTGPDSEYIDNWTDKMDLLCESRVMIGLLGFSFFLGVVLALVLVPFLAELHGKKSVFLISIAFSIVGQAGLLFLADGIKVAILFMFLIGATWPGKKVVGQSYILDFFPIKYQGLRILMFSLFDYPSILLISLSYQYLDRSWYNQQLTGMILSCICLLYVYFIVPESPKHLYLRSKFDESRAAIEYVKRWNGDKRLVNVIFDTEHQKKLGRSLYVVYQRDPRSAGDDLQPGELGPLIPVEQATALRQRAAAQEAHRLRHHNEDGDDHDDHEADGLIDDTGSEESDHELDIDETELIITEEEKKYYDRLGNMREPTFKLNAGFLALMWSTAAFSTFLLHFQLKYLAGNIFENTDYCAASEVVAILFGGLIYNYMGGIKPTYFLAFLVSTVGGLGILHKTNDDDQTEKKLFQDGNIEFYRRMASMIFIAKFGVAMCFVATQLASITDDRFFPPERRASALSFCNLIAQSFCSLAPLINELEEPIPMIIFCLLIPITLLISVIIDIPTESPKKFQRARFDEIKKKFEQQKKQKKADKFFKEKQEKSRKREQKIAKQKQEKQKEYRNKINKKSKKDKSGKGDFNSSKSKDNKQKSQVQKNLMKSLSKD